MDARSLEDFSRSLYANLYEPAGNIDQMVSDVNDTTAATDVREQRVAKLKKAAGVAEARKFVSDEDLLQRLGGMDETELGLMYKQYNPEGKAETKEDRAKELSKSRRAVRESGVLGGRRYYCRQS
jgi:hypothetical protein